MSSWTVTARWVFPVSGPPLERGVLTVVGERIAALGPHGTRQADLDLGNVALLPGLVNAHTHLDLTGLRGQISYHGDFTTWLGAVIRHRRARSEAEVGNDIRAGLYESLHRGVTLLADIAGQGMSAPLLAEAPLRSVVFYELLGLTRLRAGQAWALALDWLRQAPNTANCRPGLSPHAPYSVRSSLLRAAAALTAERRLPLMIHLAETQEEQELLATHAGSFLSFLTDLGVWDAAGLVRDAAEVVRQTADVPHVLFAHGNYLEPGLPLRRNNTVVYCPRTHAYFGHAPHGFREMLARGVRLALGTDSLASSPDLDVLAEARFLHERFPDVSGAALLRMATLSGAEALGWDDETGSLDVGKSADFSVVPLLDQEMTDPHELLLRSEQGARQVFCRGRAILKAEEKDRIKPAGRNL